MMTIWMFCFQTRRAQDRPGIVAQQLFRSGIAQDWQALVLPRATVARRRERAVSAVNLTEVFLSAFEQIYSVFVIGAAQGPAMRRAR